VQNACHLLARIVVALTFVGPARAEDFPAEPQLRNDASGERIEWRQLDPLPDAHGFGGAYVGVDHGALIVAGGANFPEGPPWQDGPKRWHDRIFVLESPEGQWREAGRLPQTLAYGAAVATPDGLLLIGGDHEGAPVSTVYRVSWNPKSKAIAVEELPSLPAPATNIVAGKIGSTAYVVASVRSESADHFDEKHFWALDLNQLRTSPRDRQEAWRALPTWPGPARHQAVVGVQADGSGQQQLYLFGGADLYFNKDGTPDHVRSAHFSDGYRFDPATGSWSQLAGTPLKSAADKKPGDEDAARIPIVAAPAAAIGDNHLLVFSGSTGEFSALPVEQRPPFTRDVWAYHAITDTWTRVGQMPIGVVTATAVRWGNLIVVPSGEVQPGVRTPAVQAARIAATAKEFGALNYAVLVAYLLGVVAIGAMFAWRTRSTDDFFRGGQRIPFWAAGLSIFATMLSSITFMALPAKAYATNWLYYPGQLTVIPIALFVVYAVLPFFRQIDATSAYEYLEKRFSRPVRLLGSAQFILFQVGRMAIVMYLPALALATVTPLTVGQCVILMGVLSLIYCTLGGVEAVVWTDAVQAVVLIGGLVVAIIVAVGRIDGGAAAAWSTAVADGKTQLANLDFSLGSYATTALWVVLVGQFFQSLYSYTSDQAIVQRYLTTKDERAARRAIWTNAWMSVFGSFLFFVLGAALYVYYKQQPEDLDVAMKADSVFPLFIATQLPAGIAGLIVAGIFAAAQSTISTSMNSTATALVTDFCMPFNLCRSDESYLRLARLFTAIIGAAGTGVAYWFVISEPLSMFDEFVKVIGMFGGALCGLFMLGMLTRRANAWGGVVGVVLGAAVVWGAMELTRTNQFLFAAIGTTVTFVTGYAASLLFPANRADLAGLTVYDLQRRERE
jgi:SSS family solute:Na+ symporter